MAGHAKPGNRFAVCGDCQGAGESRGVFHYTICMTCNGLGEVDANTGEAFSDQEISDRLRERNRALLRAYEELKRLKMHRLSDTDRQALKNQPRLR